MNEVRVAILSNCRDQWLKVARVVWCAHSQLSLPDDDHNYASVENELKRMIDDGIIEISGDISKWRESEVRQVALDVNK